MAEDEGHVPTESPRQRSEVPRSARRAAASRKPTDDEDAYENFDEGDVAGALRHYLIKHKLQDAVLIFGGREVAVEALWHAVKHAGGYEKVSEVKGWSGIGRYLGAEKATDLSHRVKKSYEKMLLPFEQALEKGQPLEAIAARPHSFKGVKGLKLAGTKIDKGAKRRGRPKSGQSGSGLVEQRIVVKWITEDQSEVLYIGRVESFRKGWHKVLFDDGDRVEYKLEDETWRLATPEDEAEAAAQSGAVAFPPAHGPPLHTPSAPGLELLSDASRSPPADERPLEADASGALEYEHDEGPDMYGSDRDCSLLVDHGDKYQVRKLEQEGGREEYEIHAQLPGINKQGVKVKCWPDGRVRIRGIPDPGAMTWVPAPIEYNVQLPVPVDPHSARALLTLHGLLLVTACAAVLPDAGPGPTSPVGAAAAAADAVSPADAAAPADADPVDAGMDLDERPMEVVI